MRQPGPRPLLLGHRGARAFRAIPENTLASFDHALADGCDGFEFDVRITCDDKPVVCHDPKFGAVEIARAPVQQLAALPQLEDVLARYQDRAFLDIELKVPGSENIVVGLLRKHTPRRGFVVSSFLPEALRAVHGEDSTIPLGLICETKTQMRNWSRLPIGYVIPHYRLVTKILLQQLEAKGRKILVWTVNAPKDMERFALSGADGIISDDTNLLCRTLTAQ